MKVRNEFGFGAKRISYFLSDKGIYVKHGTIASWLYFNKKPFDDKLVTQIPASSKELTLDKAYLLGVLCGDGYITTLNRLGLDVCDLDFIQEFDRCLGATYDLNLKIKERSKETNLGRGKLQYCGILTSKNVCLDLLRYTSFKTKEWKVPKEILGSVNLKIKSAVLRGLFDSEGTIRLKKKGHAYLQVCSGNKESLFVVKEMLAKDFNINMGVKYNQTGVMVLYSERYKNIKNFSNGIGFTIGRKQQMLVFCLSSYKRKGLRKYSKEFKIEVLNLLDQGFTAYSIGKLLKFPYTNIYDFIKQNERGDLNGRN